MCWSQLPLLVGDGSHLIYLQLPGDSVSIRAGWQHSTMQRRESGRRGGSVKDPALRCLFTENGPGGVSLSDIHKHKHTVSHIAPDTSGVCSTHTHTHELCSHPPLPLIQCSNSTLFCNTVTQSHQLFIADFCTCSVVGLIDTEEGIQGWRG